MPITGSLLYPALPAVCCVGDSIRKNHCLLEAGLVNIGWSGEDWIFWMLLIVVVTNMEYGGSMPGFKSYHCHISAV